MQPQNVYKNKKQNILIINSIQLLSNNKMRMKINVQFYFEFKFLSIVIIALKIESDFRNYVQKLPADQWKKKNIEIVTDIVKIRIEPNRILKSRSGVCDLSVRCMRPSPEKKAKQNKNDRTDGFFLVKNKTKKVIRLVSKQKSK